MSGIIVKIITVVLGYSRLSVAKLVAAVESVIFKMDGNANFPTPVPDLITITAAKNELVDAAAEALKGGPAATAMVKVKRRALMLHMTSLRGYVETTSNTDAATAEQVALTSGMGVKRMTLPPKNVFRVKNTKVSGVVKITCPKVKDDVTFNFESTSTPDLPLSYVAIGADTKSTRTISGLRFATNYSFRYSKLNRKTGQSTWSDVITLVVT